MLPYKHILHISSTVKWKFLISWAMLCDEETEVLVGTKSLTPPHYVLLKQGLFYKAARLHIVCKATSICLTTTGSIFWDPLFIINEGAYDYELGWKWLIPVSRSNTTVPKNIWYLLESKYYRAWVRFCTQRVPFGYNLISLRRKIT